MARKPKLGSGGRFKQLVEKLRVPKKGKKMSKKRADAIAASIGRKKYGKKKMAEMAAKGRKRKSAKKKSMGKKKRKY